MASLLHLQNTTNPSDHLVRRRVRRLIEIDDTIAYVVIEGALQRRVTVREWCVVTSAHVQLVVVLQKQGPLSTIKCRGDALGLDEEICALLHIRNALRSSLLFLIFVGHLPLQGLTSWRAGDQKARTLR
eukprot:Mycagemm_TRINITY_DN9666_c0_g2::TRINITY_DN9666_c0_g2_i1::g.2502::m.2502 type:complete len:129 gc:universal TRINITY_DN9666_c0_g2_i1:391-5(-)